MAIDTLSINQLNEAPGYVIYSNTFISYCEIFFLYCMFQIVSEFQKNGMDFILKAINLPTYLEDLTGLTELKKSANSFEVDWDIEDDIDEDECVEI